MRVSVRVCACACAVSAASALIACGGGTPPAKDSDEAVASSAAKSADHPPADEAPDAGPGGDPLASAGPSSGPPTAQPSSPSSPSASDSSSPGGDDPWMASHQMTPKDVLHGTRPLQSKAQACFRAGVKRDPSTSGEVKIRFVITNAGAVRVWRDEGSSMSDAEVIQCIGEVVKSVKFPKQKSPGDAWGIYSVNFGN
jgi:hypothetical protein